MKKAVKVILLVLAVGAPRFARVISGRWLRL
jgi:hypothetical protein